MFFQYFNKFLDKGKTHGLIIYIAAKLNSMDKLLDKGKTHELIIYIGS